jgi:putative transposase
MIAAMDLSQKIGIQPACDALGLNRASFYRAKAPHTKVVERPRPPLELSREEEQHALDMLHSERFMNCSPYQVYATLLDEGVYLCSIRTFYRILERHSEVRERRNQLRHPNYSKPELLATAPNQVWSWDITKLKGAAKWSYFHLYVIIDIFSRCVVGWMVAHREATELAKRLISESCARQNIQEGALTIHADRGSSMTSKGVEQLLVDLGVTKTHSRPHVSNDNPYSEAHFKTLKYRPTFPAQFGSLEDARSFCPRFSTGTTMSIITPVSRYLLRLAFITAKRPRLSKNAIKSYKTLLNRDLYALKIAFQPLNLSQRPLGLTRHRHLPRRNLKTRKSTVQIFLNF